MGEEIVWNGHDNSIDLILKQNNTAVDLSGTTMITASFGKRRIESNTPSTNLIRWSGSGYVTGEIRLFLGATDVKPGLYDVPIITYQDGGSSNGIVWGTIKIRIRPEIEASAT